MMAPPEDRPTLRPTLYAIRDLPYEMGPYRLTRKLPEGMAEVYEGVDLETPRPVAVKFLRHDMLMTDEARQRFLQEIELAANLDHSGVVPVLRSGTHEGVPYYAMPFIKGKRLDQYLEEDCPTLHDKLYVFLDLCRVVSALHKRDWAHRDLKPGNILVDPYGTIRLLDFGLAKDTRALTQPDSRYAFLGTLGYMAPEQAGGDAEKAGPEADVYAIGVLMYRALTGEMPHADDPNPDVMLQRLREECPRPIRSWGKDIPPIIEALINDCLKIDPAQRPQKAVLVENRLQLFLVRKPLPSSTPFFVMAALLAAAVGSYFIGSKDESAPEQTPGNPAVTDTAENQREEGSDLATTNASPEDTAANPIADKKASTPEPILPLVEAGDYPVPQSLWPVVTKLKAELRDDFSRRRQGAILLHLPDSAAEAMSITVTDSATTQTYRLAPGQSIGAYVEAGHPAIVNDGTQRIRVKVEQRQVNYLPLY